MGRTIGKFDAALVSLESEAPQVEMNVLPDWEVGTPGILCAAGPRAIPISTGLRAGDDRILFALARRRATLAALREDPKAAFCVLGAGVAFTAHGTAAVLREEMEIAEHVAALELRVERVQDHLADGRTDLISGARWRWRTERFVEDDQAILEELVRLAFGDRVRPKPA